MEIEDYVYYKEKKKLKKFIDDFKYWYSEKVIKILWRSISKVFEYFYSNDFQGCTVHNINTIITNAIRFCSFNIYCLRSFK